jgi:hypothetical protein
MPPPIDYTQPQQNFNNQPLINPYYLFGCLDTAFNYRARIQLIIRAFDTLAGWTCNNNPYSIGVNPGFGDPLHNVIVWEDFNYTGHDATANTQGLYFGTPPLANMPQEVGPRITGSNYYPFFPSTQ